tara:strand:+ start:477 stop:1463 length:987 start_codon:yes stop_codon:yes gene_type:complete
MKRNFDKENNFYSKKFKFSYSSLNKLLFSPSLFYRDYILEEREIKTDKHLIEGKLIHLLLLQPEEFDKEFILSPSKTPSDAVRRVLKDISNVSADNLLNNVEDDLILVYLKKENLYQSFKDDQKRIDKIRTLDNAEYYKFLAEEGKDIIDHDTLERCKKSVEILKDNKAVSALFTHEVTDFEMDDVEVFNEAKLSCELKGYDFGLKGIVDRYVIDNNKKEITIIDLKTTSKTVADFKDTIEYYNYWLQAAMYVKLVIENLTEELVDYKINFNFVVIDKYEQTYVFPVSQDTLNTWGSALLNILDVANFHYTEKRYDLPYEYAKEQVIL